MIKIPPRKINAVLIAAGKYHDIDFARSEILRILGEDGRIRTRVFEDYSNEDAITSADLIISYTCDVIPTECQQAMLREFIVAGGRWFALHGTNSVLRFTHDGRVDAPDAAPRFMELLGSSFASHPPIGRYTVEIADRNHPLTAGLEPFEVEDELYLSRLRADIHVLLDVPFEGSTPRFVDAEWPAGRYPVMYLRSLGKGAILYLTLGHCRGHYDMHPLTSYYSDIERGSWDNPIFYDLLRRGTVWGVAASATDSRRCSEK